MGAYGMDAAVSTAWVTPFSSKIFLEQLPDTVIPLTSDCLNIISLATSDTQVINTFVRAMPEQISKALGLDTSNTAVPAGMGFPAGGGGFSSGDGAGTSRTARSRSRSQSPGRDGGGDDRGRSSTRDRFDSYHRPTAPRSVPVKRVHWRNSTDFSYSRDGPVVAPHRAARDLGVSADDFCWPVVASTKPDPARRDDFCQTPDHPGCRTGARHFQSDKLACLLQ
eukprot:2531295-Prymnesium_polylepis.1